MTYLNNGSWLKTVVDSFLLFGSLYYCKHCEIINLKAVAQLNNGFLEATVVVDGYNQERFLDKKPLLILFAAIWKPKNKPTTVI